ncbi:MAG: shikimate kinase [Hyphomicrobiales bacterium]
MANNASHVTMFNGGKVDSSVTARQQQISHRETVLAWLGARAIVLVGLMGAGKTTTGRCLARHFGLPFVDADAEIERAANKTTLEIFADHGEAGFRIRERRVIARLLRAAGPRILATGGGAYIDPQTRAVMARNGVSVWLRAGLPVLAQRVRCQRADRPLLDVADPEAVMRRLIKERHPFYDRADIVIDSGLVPKGKVVHDIVQALAAKARLDQPRARGLEVS